jgi:hypothetical protein
VIKVSLVPRVIKVTPVTLDLREFRVCKVTYERKVIPVTLGPRVTRGFRV